MATNGEAFIQRCAIAGATREAGGTAIFLDIGANVGLWTILLYEHLSAEQRQSIRSYAFEPVPETFDRLRENLAGIEDAVAPKTMQIAFSDEPGEAEMALLHRFAGINSLEFDESMAAAAQEIIRVRKTTLSTFCEEENIDRIHFAKIDTEGHDSLVLRGALELFRAGRIDAVQFEYNHRWVYSRTFLKDVFDLIDGLPYSIARIRSDRLEIFDEWHPEMERYFESNYAIVADSALEWFPVLKGHYDAANTYA